MEKISSSNQVDYQSKLSLKKCNQTDKVYSTKTVTKINLVPRYQGHRP